MARTVAERREFVERQAQRMVANPTPAEERLWGFLKPLGFFRQYCVEGQTKNGGAWSYILDFYSGPYHKVCVEVDGSSHRKRKGRDRRRDARLAGAGIRTIRVSNADVMKRLEQTCEKIFAYLGAKE